MPCLCIVYLQDGQCQWGGHALNDGSHGTGSDKAGSKEGQGEQAVVVYGARVGAVHVW